MLYNLTTIMDLVHLEDLDIFMAVKCKNQNIFVNSRILWIHKICVRQTMKLFKLTEFKFSSYAGKMSSITS